MGQPRTEFQRRLREICDNVYFQPPNGTLLKYPCIVYSRNNIDVDYSSNFWYRSTTRYSVTIIDRNPDSELKREIEKFPLCSFDRFFTADDLNHDIYNVYF